MFVFGHVTGCGHGTGLRCGVAGAAGRHGDTRIRRRSTRCASRAWSLGAGPHPDRTGTLFYLNQPYWGSEGDHGRDLFGREQFEFMAEQLTRLHGRFILLINNVPEIRRIFAAFAFEEVGLNYSLAKGKATPARELIVSGRIAS